MTWLLQALLGAVLVVVVLRMLLAGADLGDVPSQLKRDVQDRGGSRPGRKRP